MYQNFIKSYINKLQIEDIYYFCKKEGIKTNDKDINLIFKYIKTYQENLIKDPLFYINDIKDKISPYSYNEILKLYNKYKKLV